MMLIKLVLICSSTGLKPKTAVAERLATICVLPLLLAGVLGSPKKHELLTEYLRNLLIRTSGQESQTVKREIFFSVRFLWFVPF